jgi:GNAT superfamily N-acetyltransferase
VPGNVQATLPRRGSSPLERGDVPLKAQPRADHVVVRAMRVLHDEGLRNFWFKLIGELGYRRVLVVAYRLQEPVPEFVPRLAVRTDLLGKGDVDAYLAFRPESDRAGLINRLDSGQLCFVAWHAGQIVSACWTAVRPTHIPFLDCDTELAPGEVYLYERFTAQAYRGQRLAHAVRTYQLRYLRNAGYRRAIGAIVPENRRAVLESRRGGFRPVGLMGRIKIGPWQRHFRRRWE